MNHINIDKIIKLGKKLKLVINILFNKKQRKILKICTKNFSSLQDLIHYMQKKNKHYYQEIDKIPKKNKI